MNPHVASVAACCCLGISLLPGALHAAPDLASQFAQPPAEVHPHTWWHWCNGNVSKEGITLDLEAMHRIGITGAEIFNVAPKEIAPGPVETLGPEWRELTKFAIQEADRIGIELAIHNCAGWSESGGPWITPELSMQKVVWSTTQVSGPGQIKESLQQPDTLANYYKDIAVLAFPSLPKDDWIPDPSAIVMASGTTKLNAAAIFEKNGEGAKVVFAPGETSKTVDIQFPTEIEPASVQIRGAADGQIFLRLQASTDGNTFEDIGSCPFESISTFKPTKAKWFRIVLTIPHPLKRNLTAGIRHIEFHGPRIPDSAYKAGFAVKFGAAFSNDAIAMESCVPKEKIIDLSSHLDANGMLTWDVPAGNWTVIRFGHTSTGKTTHPSSKSATGLECDKMSREAVEAHFQGMMAKVIADAGPLVGKSLKMILADSWEAGCENWTPRMREEFQKRRGYDPTPMLIALTGIPVGTSEQSERFLWDFRRTIADLIAENHYGVLQELCHQHGLKFIAEAPGIHMPTIADELQCKAYTDIPMGEFWMDGLNDSKEPACAAHVGGQNIAAAEAFTAVTKDAKWSKAPFDHKALGDLNFCRGINRFVFHRYAMQPWKDRVPGMTMGPWGTNFERTNTWWEQAKPWMDYISRCQLLLQAGKFDADVLYFYG